MATDQNIVKLSLGTWITLASMTATCLYTIANFTWQLTHKLETMEASGNVHTVQIIQMQSKLDNIDNQLRVFWTRLNVIGDNVRTNGNEQRQRK